MQALGLAKLMAHRRLTHTYKSSTEAALLDQLFPFLHVKVKCPRTVHHIRCPVAASRAALLQKDITSIFLLAFL